MLTGLYTHQTGCMITGGSTLDPGFPTWGTMLREHGYETRWYGKWHLTHHDNKWTPGEGQAAAGGLRLRRRHLPIARRRPRPGLAGGPADRPPVRRLVRPRGGRRAVVHDGLVRQPTRHRLVVQVERSRPCRGAGAERDRTPAAQLRDAGAADRAQQAAACNAPSRTPRPPRSDRSRSPAPKRAANGWNSSTST